MKHFHFAVANGVEKKSTEKLNATDTVEKDKKPEEKPMETDAEDNIGKCKKWADFICGIPDAAEEQDLEEEVEQKRIFLKENKFWSKILNINACIGMIVIAFLIGFFR